MPSDRRTPRAIVIALALMLLAAVPASAETVNVDLTGADSAACGQPASPCLSVAQGVANAASGDTVDIHAGTFPMANSISVPATKGITIKGAGQGLTTLDGQNLTTLSSDGMFAFRGSPGVTSSQTLHGFTVVGMGRKPAATYPIGISAQLGGNGAVNIDAYDLTFTGGATGKNGIALYTSGNAGGVGLRNSTITNLAGNNVLIEQHPGPVTITKNTIVPPATSLAAPIYAFTFRASPTSAFDGTVTGRYEISDNTITAPAGIAVIAGFQGKAGAYSGPVDITGNTFNQVGRGLTGVDLSNILTTGEGDIARVNVSRNTLRTSLAGTGVRIIGNITAPKLTRNSISGFNVGIAIQRTGSAAPTGASIQRNRIVGNTLRGVSNTSGVTADATENWWGCNAGPGNSGCDAATDAVTSPNQVLRISAAPASIGRTGTSTVTADIGRDSAGTPQDVFDDGLPLTFTPSGGTVSPATVPLAGQEAATTFTSTQLAGRSVSTKVDNQTVTTTFPDADNAPPTITNLTYDGAGNLAADVADDSAVASCGFSVRLGSEGPFTDVAGTLDDSGRCTGRFDGGFGPGDWTVRGSVTDDEGVSSTVEGQLTVVAKPVPAPPAVIVTVPVPTPDVTPRPNPVEPPLGSLPASRLAVACNDDRLIVTSINRMDGEVRILGAAPQADVGKTLTVTSAFSNDEVLVRGTVSGDGSFNVRAPLPPERVQGTNDARYRVSIDGDSSPLLKFGRRVDLKALTGSKDGVRITGAIRAPRVPGAKVEITIREDCKTAKIVGRLTVSRSGRFAGTLRLRTRSAAVIVRVRAVVRSTSGKRFRTYSIARPVDLG